jgi:hypothetical protein
MKNREVFKIGGDKEKMKKQIITLTAIVAILAAAIFAGCVEKETPVSTPPTPVLTYQDSEYTDWAIDTASSISLDLDLMSSAAEMFDFEGVERYSGMLYGAAKKALDEIDQFDVSSH